MSTSASNASPTKELRCPECGKLFGRLEHLKRHILIHTREKSFSCRECSKEFFRRDALQRHELTHRTAPSLLKRGARACTKCAAAKARCSGEGECARCRTRGDTCVYPDARDLDGMQLANSPNADPSTTLQSQHPETSPTQFVAQQNLHTPQAAQQHDSIINDINDGDAWDPTVLASTNWLDALDGYEFMDFTIPTMPPSLPTSGYAPAELNPPGQILHSLSHTPMPTSGCRQAHTLHNTTPGAGVETHSLTESSVHDEDTPETGRFYIDGGPARLPRTKRRRRSSMPSVQRSVTMGAFSLENNIPHDLRASDLMTTNVDSHRMLRKWYEQVCLNPQSIWPAFQCIELPSTSVFNHLLHLYFINFDQVFPFMHRATLQQTHTDAVLILAMASIGSFYLPEETGAPSFTPSLLEFTRRILLYQAENSDFEPNIYTFARVRFLLSVGLPYGGDKRLARTGLDQAHILKEIRESALDEFNRLGPAETQDYNNAESRWIQWSRRETAIRLTYSAWLVDCMGKFHLGTQPSLRLSDACLPLPCPEDLWNAQTAQQWSALEESRSKSCNSLPNALCELYIEKRLPRTTGEFARIIMIHGLFHRHWEVESYHSNPMSSWEPTAERQSSSSVLQPERLWLPAIPTFTKWQNSAMDALDILHWQANATIGQASGLEHPTVLHLHLARIVLLAPYAEILHFAKGCASRATNNSAEREVLRRWAVQHQYKARLAAIHAGVVFWHIRRYSIDAFYEASAVGLAALTLWTFGTFATQTPKPTMPARQPDSAPMSSDSSEEVLDNIILLDRPTDDELVQKFIRHDEPFQAHLTGVGDLYGKKGPQRVLVEGCKLLSTLRCWSSNASWLQVLQGLSNAYSKG